MAPVSTPSSIEDIDEADDIRVLVYASNQPVHAPLVEAVRAGAKGRLIPKGGNAGEALVKASSDDYDVTWSPVRSIHAWINFNGESTPAIRDSEGIASITDNGTGDYTLNFSASIGAGASVTITAGDTGTAGTYTANLVEITTQGVRFQVRDLSGDPIDVDTICAHVFGKIYNWLVLSGDEQSGLDKITLSGDAAPGVLLLSPPSIA